MICEHCGKPTEKTRANKRFCSYECRTANQNQQKREKRRDTSLPFTCEECGSIIIREGKSGRFPRFCSLRCLQARDRHHRAKARPPRICRACGGVFTPKRSDAFHCSSNCARTTRARRQGKEPLLSPQERLANGLEEDKQTGCWEWQRGKLASGYGSIAVDGKRKVTHRYTWEVVVGEIPEGAQIDHLCRNRLCCRPSHLEPVTQQENLARNHITKAQHMGSRQIPLADQFVLMTLADLVAMLTGSRDHLEESRRE